MSLDQHSVPGVSAGFVYQFERAIYWLAKSPAGAVVGIETAGDIAIKETDGTLYLEEDKHSIREDSKPFGDRSRDLWNTLATWLEALEAGEVEAERTRFLMVTNKRLPECLVVRISRAEGKKQIDACVAELEEAGKAPPKTIAVFVERVLQTASRSWLTRLLGQCELVDASAASAGSELRKKMVAHLQLPEWCSAHSASLVNETSGWLQKTALAAWRERRPAWIRRDHFVNQLHAAIDRRKRQMKRERAENLIPVTAEKVGKQRGRPFVRQVFLITDEEGVITNAIREFIRCSTEKMRLSAEGNITDEIGKRSKRHFRLVGKKFPRVFGECPVAAVKRMWALRYSLRQPRLTVRFLQEVARSRSTLRQVHITDSRI